MEQTLKNLVRMRVLGHLDAGAGSDVLAKDVSKFCRQICAQIKGVSESKEIMNRGYKATTLTE